MTQLTNLQRRRYPNPDPKSGNEYFRWVEKVGPHVRVLTDEEVDALEGQPVTYTATIDGVGDVPVSVRFSEGGFKVENCKEYGWEGFTACHAAKLSLQYRNLDRKALRKLVDPEGNSPDIVRVRYVTGGTTTLVPYIFLRDDIEAERDCMGAKIDGGRVLSWLYGFGSHRHIEGIREAAGIDKYWEMEDSERKESDRVSLRATLAVLRFFKMYPIRRHVWRLSAEETPHTVEMQINDGPWRVINGKGLPVTET